MRKEARRAYVVTANWPVRRLTTVGRMTNCFTCGGVDHVGIYLPECTHDEVVAHSNPRISHTSARGSRHVTFDFMREKVPKFQSVHNHRYWTNDCDVRCYEIKNISASVVHAICVDVALAAPYNSPYYRLNLLLCCGCLPCHIVPANTPSVAQSHCAALAMRIVAAARSGTREPLQSDAATLAVLGLDTHTPLCGRRMLVTFTPDSAVREMARMGLLASEPKCGFSFAMKGVHTIDAHAFCESLARSNWAVALNGQR
jgi:hypothetical protein